MKSLSAVLIGINLFGFMLIGYDKLMAKKRGWRIPELNIFILAVFGAAAGVFVGMKVFRHKTRHNSFTVGVPLLLGFNLLAVYLLARHL